MELFLDFQPLTPRLHAIKVPTMILNGEFDFLTPRLLHETLRTHIKDSALVIVPRSYHAFTLEKPELTAWLLTRFTQDVLDGNWTGGGTVWLAPEQPGEVMIRFPDDFDHLRAVPVRRSKAALRRKSVA